MSVLFDVAVIGYGPVGVTAANLLGRMGLKVLVVERDPEVYSRARAISTDEEIVRVWQRAGLADELVADMLPDRDLTFVDARGRTFLQWTPRSRGNGHPAQLFLYQPALERTLRSGVHRYRNVDVRLGFECTDLTQDADGVTLTVRPSDSDGGVPETYRASYVIAADGGSSPTRTRLSVGFEGRTYEERWVVIDTRVKQEWPEIDRLRFHCDPARPAVDCPTPLGHHRWEFPVLPGDDESALVSPDGVRALLAGHGIGPEHVEVLRAVVYSHHVRFADRWRVRRVFLAGDAAHVMPPWVGQGMASGVRDVDNLCWKLAAAVRGDLAANELERLLESYETERMPHVRSLTKAAVFFGRVIKERRRVLTRLRDPLFRVAARLPVVGSFLRNVDFLAPMSCARGFLAGDPVGSRRGAGRAVGKHLPQPWVVDADGTRTRLDDALGHIEWTVLHTGPEHPSLQLWRDAGVHVVELREPGSTPAPGTLVDVDGLLTGWLEARSASALAVRPDAIVYAAAGPGRPLSTPPLRSTAPTQASAPASA